MLGSYRYDAFRTGDDPGALATLVIADGPGAGPTLAAGAGAGGPAGRLGRPGP